jgi:hypothetical protein
MGIERADLDAEHAWEDQGYNSERYPPQPPPIHAAIRAPLDYAYSAAELMAALPRSEAVDAAALPAALQRKARSHRDDLDNIIESQHLTTRRRRDAVWAEIARAHRFAAPMAKYGATAAAALSALMMARQWWHHPAASAADVLTAAGPFGGLAIVVTAVALLTRCARRRTAAAPPWVYSDDELKTLDAASIDWPAVPEELDRYANGTALRREWHGTWLARIQPGGAALVWREPHLVAVAALLGRDIQASPTWHSELLDIHRVRIDLDRTLDEVYIRAHRIWRARANLVAPTTADPTDVVARRDAEITDAADDAWTTLVALVRQLQGYRSALASVDAIQAEITALQQSSLRITDAAVQQLHVDAAGNDLHADAVGAATRELADLNANLAARLTTLRHTLTTATNGLVLRAP